jgi:hypothetical protein
MPLIFKITDNLFLFSANETLKANNFWGGRRDRSFILSIF